MWAEENVKEERESEEVGSKAERADHSLRPLLKRANVRTHYIHTILYRD